MGSRQAVNALGTGNVRSRRTGILGLLLALLLVAGCSKSGEADERSEAPSAPDASVVAPPDEDDDWVLPSEGSLVAAEPRDAAAYIYDPSEVRTYELQLDPSDLAAIDADPTAQQYVPGQLLFEGREYGPVGIRYKGSTGSFIGCVGGTSFFDPSGPRTCPKLSMKVSFNHIDRDGRFYGLKKLQFHAMRADTSMMRERLGYYVFRRMGVPAPRAVHARLLINGEYVGLFALVEQIDDRFTRSRFGDGGKGNLYKEAWPMYDDEQVYLDSLRSNRSEPLSAERMVSFAQAIDAADDATLVQVVDGYLDRAAIVRYLAVDRAIGHDDGPLAFYCNTPAGQGANPGPFGNHNYFWYEDQTSDPRLWMIAWDLDMSFDGFPIPWDHSQPWYEPLSGPVCVCPEPSPLSRFVLERRPTGCDRLFQGFGMLREEYRGALRTLLDGPYSAQHVDERLAAWEAQIAPFVEEQAQDPEQVSVDDWQGALRRLRNTVSSLRSRAQSELED